MKRVILTVVVTLLVVIAVPLVVLAAGLVNVGATSKPGFVEASLANFAVNRSLARRAPNESNPFADNPQAIATGLHHYAEMCVRCHGGPGVEPDEFAQGLNPPAPKLDHAAEDLSDGELFWITKHGIRMTGMPAFGVTHNDDDIWKIAALVKQLPRLSAEQKQELARISGEGSDRPEHHARQEGKNGATEDNQHQE